MKYTIVLNRAAEKELEKLAAPIYDRLSLRILSLEDDPRPRGASKLSGREEYRLRAGDYRVLFTVDDKKAVVTVFAVGHRKDVHR